MDTNNSKNTQLKYKMVITDFDDTLNYDYTVSKRTLNAIDSYRKLGGIFTISTGRSFAGIKNYLHLYGLDKIETPIMCCQGASCNSSLSGKVIFEEKLENKLATEWLKQAQSLGIYVQMYIDDVMHIDHRTEYTKVYIQVTQLDFLEVGDLVKFLSESKKNPHKFVIVDEAHNIINYQKLFGDVWRDMQFCISHPRLMEITSARAGKGNMAKIVAQRMNIDMSQIVAIGDSQNDISMLKVAGLSVAVANARPEVKSIVHMQTDACFQDGVAKVLEKIIEGTV
jgi:Cof subfamily protein (haloacid dehalogenase superfamily)